ncbi:unnamed protein product [Diatraea saccharalis]|uniref:Uncharacterized protein n=1 Tax=Diatraea saccharalis TaxID=40085 RepID=A0A9N9R6T4_9NEOP|nr:unnamed protein product [Diatraea saccharalis]
MAPVLKFVPFVARYIQEGGADEEWICRRINKKELENMIGYGPKVHVVTVLAGKLGVNLATQNVVCATRVGRAPKLGEAEKSLASRPRPIVVRLARRVIRDERRASVAAPPQTVQGCREDHAAFMLMKD